MLTPWLLQTPDPGTAMLRGPALAASLAAAPRTRNTQPSHQDTRGDAQPGADASLLATGRVETKPHQGGSDLKCGFPLHLDNWD